jgi:hypothetical protein
MLCRWDVLSPVLPTLALLAHRCGWGRGGRVNKVAAEFLPLAQVLAVQREGVGEGDRISISSSSSNDFALTSHHSIQNHFKGLHGQ